MHPKFITPVLVFSPFLFAVPGSLRADERVGIQFLGGSTTAQLGTTETAGIPLTAQPNWNYTDFSINGTTDNILGPISAKLVNETGTATPMTVTWNSTNTYNTTNGITTPDSKLINGYLDNTGAGASVTISDIPWAAYSVVVYFGSDGNGRTGQVNDETTGVKYSFSSSSNLGRGFLPADYKITSDTGTAYPAANYCIFAGTDPAVTISMIRGSNNTGIHAIQIVKGGDTDGDGMPDSYEQANGLNYLVNDRDSDKDNDGSSNFQEYNLGTKPNVADTDGDGLLDGVETNTGIYIDPQHTGSDPLKKDTDGDGIEDGPEVATSGSDPWVTNPVDRDTDHDGYTDGYEVAKGTNPTLASSNPSVIVAGQIGINFTGGYNGFSSPVTGSAGVGSFAQTNWNNINGATGSAAPLVNSTGAAVDATLSWNSAGTWAGANPDPAVTVPADGDAMLMEGYLDTSDTSTTTVSVLNIPYRKYDVVLYIDGDSGDGSRFGDYTVNGVTRTQVRDSANWPVVAGGADTYAPVVSSRSSGNYLIFRNVSGGSAIITAKPTTTASFRAPLNAVQILSAVDTDGDGMPDQWETDYGFLPGNAADGALDKDNDGLTNAQEYAAGTDPTVDDTDGDGLKDGVENASGAFVNAGKTGSKPLDPDTDGDTLTDGDEVKAALPSDPNKTDTDDDGYSDAMEVANGLNPGSALSPANLIDSRRAIGVRFNGNEGNSLLPTEAAGYFASRQTHWNNADGSPNGDTANITSPTAATLVDNAGAATATTVTWTSNGVYTTTNGTASPDAKLMNGYLDTTAADSHSTVTFNGIPFARYDVVVYFGSDGNDRTGSIASETAGKEFFYRTAANNAAGGFAKSGYLETTATEDATTANPQTNFCRFTDQTAADFVMQVNRGSNNSGFFAVQVVETPDLPRIPVTSITRSPAGAVTVVWTSTPAATYIVERSPDLTLNSWSQLSANYPATGTSTSYTDSTLPANTKRMFYRIRQN